METSYRKEFEITTAAVDCFGRLKPSWLLYFCQQVAGEHCTQLEADLKIPEHKHLFWAIIRNRVQITRLPREKEVITVETWPMPTTRVAYPRATVAYDKDGQELFRCISLWVLMDRESRAMVLPGKSGVTVNGWIQGNELEPPANLTIAQLDRHDIRKAGFSDLDVNGHVNNTKYLDWVDDLLPSGFHRDHSLRELVICYLSEVLEGQYLDLTWALQEGSTLRVDAYRDQENAEKKERVFSVRAVFG